MERYSNLNRVMEAENHFKNRAKLKSKDGIFTRTFLLFVLVCVSLGARAQNETGTRIPENPRNPADSITFFGRIKSVKETGYETVEKFGEVSKEKLNYSREYICDSKGNLIEFNADGIIFWTHAINSYQEWDNTPVSIAG